MLTTRSTTTRPMSVLSGRRSLVFTGCGLSTLPRNNFKWKGLSLTVTCHKSPHGTVLMEPTARVSQQQKVVPALPQLKPIVRQAVRRKRYSVDPQHKTKKRMSTVPDMQRTVEHAPAKGRQMAKHVVDAGAVASESVQHLVPNKAFPFIKHSGQQTAEGLHKPIGLILASAYLLGTVCHLSGSTHGTCICTQE